MIRQFFHNKYDKESMSILESLATDIEAGTVVVWDYMDKTITFPDIFVRTLPLMVDRELVPLSEAPYHVGVLDLQLQCRDWQGIDQDSENGLFLIYINGERTAEDLFAVNGLMQFQIETEEPCSVEIRIEREGYMPWKGVLEIVQS